MIECSGYEGRPSPPLIEVVDNSEVKKMAIGLIGRKAGMTRVFTEDGVSIPVTLIEVEPNRVTQVKTRKPMATVPCR
jgi:hypothetical protein